MNTDDTVNDALRDAAARTCIVQHCSQVSMGTGRTWLDMELADDEHIDEVTECLQWIEARGDHLHGFRAIFHPTYPSLIQFEDLH